MQKNFKTVILSAVIPLFLSACIGPGNVSPIKKPSSQDGFPALDGINLKGEQVLIPAELEGEQKLLLIAFKQEQQEQINTWLKPAKEIEANSAFFRYYEIPLIYEGSAPFRFWVNNGMRSGITDETARQRTITVYTDREEFFNLMDMEEDHIYALLLNNQNKIVWRTQGTASADKIQELQSLLDE